MKRLHLFVLLAALLSLSVLAQAASVTSVRMHKSPEYTRVVFDLSERAAYTVTTLAHPDRVVVDITASELSPRASIEATSAASAPVLALRHSNQSNRDLRWVFDLAAPAKPKAFGLPPVAPYGHRLVVDLYPQPAPANGTAGNGTAVNDTAGNGTAGNDTAGKGAARNGAAPLVNAAAHPTNQPAPVSVSMPVSATTKPSTAGSATVDSGGVAPQQTQVPSPITPAHSDQPTTHPNQATGVSLPSPLSTSEGTRPASKPNDAAVAQPMPTTSSTTSGPAAAVVPAPAAATKPTATKPTATKSTATKPITAESPSVRAVPRGQEIVVAIDAGHGGEDPGAIGDDGVQEKDVVLAIARRLAELVNAEPGFRAVLIRDGDYYIPLGLRPRKAREAGAHFFVSVHADAHTNRAARGASVYALSERGATSETAKWLAQRENSSDLVGGVSLDDKDKLLAEVLLDLSMTASLAESLEMGSHVLGNLRGVTKLHSRHVEQAGFRVLKSPDIPSILVETGYVSNAADAKQLGSAAYRTEIASAIFAGVRAQAMARPPRGTVFALRDHDAKARERVAAAATSGGAATAPALDREHRVEPGETLTRVAARFGVSQSALRRLNGLVSDTVVSGQMLHIPDRAAIDP